MPTDNFSRMMKIIDETFSTREDPDQLQVDEKVIARLTELHPASVSELNVEDTIISPDLRTQNSELKTFGPAVWVLIIPTTTDLMEEFLNEEISEQQLFEQTKPARLPKRGLRRQGDDFDCIYLCSATVLEEYRRKGLALKITVEAVRKVMEDFEIETLFVWAFSEGGLELAKRVAGEVGVELVVKE